MPMPVPKGTPPKDWVRKELTQCQHCYKSRMSGGAKLSKCGGCKIAQYCSRECQKADWQKHKDQCKSNQLLHEACPEYASEIAHLRAFCAKHRPSITDFSIRAMDLALDTTRGLRDFVFIEVERVPGEERIERAYKVKDALVMPFALLDKEDAEMYRDGMAEYHAEQQASPGQISGIHQ
ncbi:hypothetical protein D9619_010016 [Psilocybe cf. subviscida]|uniref:MYND-type domain-containing protein n=1 Tax=Psilocybe cf. subviscida TaxID=2480587 RepID=A0A8H5F6J5_9AGAR|nr:hypothetical protein D9619_010016 [Psilocybe cf. subviscida]